MTGRPRQRLSRQRASATPLYDEVCEALGVPAHGARRELAVGLADALLPSLAQLEPLP